MRVRRAAPLAAIVLATLSACAPVAPIASPEPTPSEPTPTAQLVNVDVYFAHSQPTRITLISEPHMIEVSDDVLEGVLGALVAGDVQPHDADYDNLWGDNSVVLSTSRSGDVLTVDLSVATVNWGAEAESIAIAQLVWTAVTIDTSLTALQLTLDGAVAETLGGHVDITAPIAPEPAEN
ncbi:MAG: GerMN domain-containing protein, partial [Microcella sp.]|nr:GerMN domain-containing protein [Microcella sp.]